MAIKKRNESPCKWRKEGDFLFINFFSSSFIEVGWCWGCDLAPGGRLREMARPESR